MAQTPQDPSLNLFMADTLPSDSRQARQLARRQLIVEAVMAEGAIRIEDITERFDISLMTAHRDIDELVERGLCINLAAWSRRRPRALWNPVTFTAPPVSLKRSRRLPKWRQVT